MEGTQIVTEIRMKGDQTVKNSEERGMIGIKLNYEWLVLVMLRSVLYIF